MEKSAEKNFIILTDDVDQYSNFITLLRGLGWTVSAHGQLSDLRSKISSFSEILSKSCLALLSPIRHSFSQSDIKLIRKFIATGNSLIIAACDEDTGNGTNLNDISSEYGVKFMRNCVIRPNPYKQYHPKQVMLEDFVVNRSFSQLIKKYSTSYSGAIGAPSQAAKQTVRLLYVDGCSLQVKTSESHVIMTSSVHAIPTNQAICSFYKGPNNSKVIALGSAAIMSDPYLGAENNMALAMALLDIIQDEQFSTNLSDARTLELPALIYTGDMIKLIDIPLPCFETIKPPPEDKYELIERRMFTFDCSKLPLVSEVYSSFGIEHEPLTLLRPDFHCEYPKLEPATHGFVLRRSKAPKSHLH